MQGVALPGQRAGQRAQRQALAVERTGLLVGQAEAAGDAVVERHDVGNQGQFGLRRPGQPAGRVEVVELQAGAGEGRGGKGGERRASLAGNALAGDHR